MMKILVTDGVAREGIELLRKEAHVDVSKPLDEAALLERISEYDGIMVRSATKVTARCIAAARCLKVIGRAGAGVDNIDVDAATRKGIVVVNAPGGNSVAVAEHTIALLLCLARNVPQACAHVKSGGWERGKFMGTEVRGKVLGIFGLGRAGVEVAKRALALGMKVLAYDPGVSASKAASMGVVPAEPEDVFANSDFISLHVPVTPETIGLIRRETIALMKEGVRIINCSRGKVVDESALVEGLKSGKVAGAALDVLASEPPPSDHPLLGFDNVIVTPHLGASTSEAQMNVALETAKAMLAVLRGEPVPNAVNIPVPAAEVFRELVPFIPLAEVLGKFASQWSEGMIASVRVGWGGKLSPLDTRPLLNSVLKGVLSPLLGDDVNMVNAPILAKERGIAISEIRASDGDANPNEISVETSTNRGTRLVAGVLSARQVPRLVQIDGYRLDMAFTPYMLVCPHVDQPGIIGMVGTTLGKARVNISEMQVARKAKGGDAIMVLGIDSPAPPEALTEIARLAGVLSVKPVYLEGPNSQAGAAQGG
ncbi:MAG: D-3-phosphoglycerate dehydrogenase / 2-oxoglutarate reductase [Bacillota bacterium]|nr:D-3-phosphoglycerate dehydrogenase / 2-oxoglutarate reductase [Bacillota bacterium]